MAAVSRVVGVEGRSGFADIAVEACLAEQDAVIVVEDIVIVVVAAVADLQVAATECSGAVEEHANIYALAAQNIRSLARLERQGSYRSSIAAVDMPVAATVSDQAMEEAMALPVCHLHMLEAAMVLLEVEAAMRFHTWFDTAVIACRLGFEVSRVVKEVAAARLFLHSSMISSVAKPLLAVLPALEDAAAVHLSSASLQVQNSLCSASEAV